MLVIQRRLGGDQVGDVETCRVKHLPRVRVLQGRQTRLKTSNSGLKVLTFPIKIPCCDGTVSKNDMIHEQVGVDLFIIFLAGP